MDFLESFISRGYFYQSTEREKLENLLKGEKITAYIGFDGTARSLHVGNLVQVMILRLLQQHGHRPIILVGGATTKVGDPSGRDESRKMLSNEDINENIEGLKRSLSKFITFGDQENEAIIVNNADWLNSLGYIDFLRDFGPLFSINRMISMDSVKSRLDREQSLSFLEFNYSLLQAYDFYHLANRYDCCLQLGGSDQWGNILMGVELTKRITGKEVFGITTPLLTTSSGAKMGKSVGGAVWLNEDMLSPYDYYQYWRNAEDLDVVRFAKLFAEFNSKEQEEFEKLVQSDINAAKKELAYKLTLLCHGSIEAEQAAVAARKVFEEGGISSNLPTIKMDFAKISAGVPAYELLHMAGLAESKSESRRLIRGKGAKLNDEVIEDENIIITLDHAKDKLIKLSAGKKKHALIKLD